MPLACIKLHFFVGKNDGTGSCDFRGDKKIGSDQGDEHKTLLELDPADGDLVDTVLEIGPKINRVLAKMVATKAVKTVLGAISKVTGGKIAGFRIGVWDGDGKV